MPAFIFFSGLLLLQPTAVAEAPLSGPWKLTGTLPSNPVGQDSVLLLMEASGKKGPWKILEHGIDAFNDAKVQATRVDPEIITLSIKGPVSIEVVLKAKTSTPNRWLGTFDLRGNWFPCVLERCQSNTLKDEKKEQQTPGSDLYKELEKTEGTDAKIKAARDIIGQHHSSPVSIKTALHVLDQILTKKESTNLAQGLKLFEEATIDYPSQLSSPLLASQIAIMARQKFEPMQAAKLLNTLKQQEIQPLSLASQRRLLKLESGIYPLVGKTQEAKESLSKLAALEIELDVEFTKTAIPFAVKPANLKSTTKSRPRVLELFTGAQCPPCVAADIAFDALEKSYTSGDLILLQYHLHIPGPDPLTNAHSELRARYYGINSTPSTYIDGAAGPAVGGLKPNAFAAYTRLVAALNETVTDETVLPVLSINAKKSPDGHMLEITHDKVEKPQQLLLRLILVENAVRYPGRNGQRIHHQVVRYFLGDHKGFALEKPQGTRELPVKLGAIKAELDQYLDDSNKRRPFLDDERPLDLSELAVVGLLQNIETKQIVQATKTPLK